ncbi:MAG TPA: triose-phosphate isomerase [Candidatus Binataceae bacterium]|nr:triose-phosphate isomerase [Candidatus Binataceae bacterium]
MRKKLFAANWKMHLLPEQARALTSRLMAALDQWLGQEREREVMVAPAAILIPAVAQVLQHSALYLGAQNMHFEDQGAFTGEISPPMLQACGVQFVILGHSERRHLFHEDDEIINRKLKAALRHNLRPILCLGETLDQRDSGRTTEVLLSQFEAGLEGLSPGDIARVTLAYEPVWAIGTGRNASPEQAQIEHGALRAALSDRAGKKVADAVRILYGGSVTPDNVDSLIVKPDIDGALVGGASLRAESFVRIVRAGLG